MNPVGVFYSSRYNGQGCDINRDFGRYNTKEARIVRDVIDEFKPDLVLSTHEGPHDGFFMIATTSVKKTFVFDVLKAFEKSNIKLSDKHFLGLKLSRPGLSHENKMVSVLKRWIKLGSLGTYLEMEGVGSITTESSWHSNDFEARINSHIMVIMSILKREHTDHNNL